MRWLHLSDLHLGCKGQALWRQMQAEFETSVRETAADRGAPDLILITGDLTNTGVETEFELVDQFLDALLGWLRQGDEEADPLIVPIPGNHDLVRPRAEALFPYRVLDRYEEGGSNEDILLLSTSLWEERDAAFVLPLFAGYQAWFERRIRPQFERSHVRVHTSHFPGDFCLELTLEEGYSVCVVGLNSAWRQYTRGDFEGKIELPTEQFHAALPQTPEATPLDVFRRCRHALLLMHHPPSWLSPQADHDFRASIYTPERFALCLHGHLHAGRSVVVSQSGGTPRHFFQAPSLFGLEHYGTPHEKRAMGYAWGHLSPGGEVRVWPMTQIRRDDGTNGFVPDLSFQANGDEGVVLRAEDPPVAGRQGHHESPPGRSPGVGEAGMDAYREWAVEHYQELDQVGIGGRDIRLRLEEVYVPRRISPYRLVTDPGDGTLDQGETWPQSGAGDIELEEIFSAGEGPAAHAAIFGDPGAGKTTALRMLLYRCLTDGGESLNLIEGTLPVFLRLRRLTGRDLERPLVDFLSHELRDACGEVLSPDLGVRLWERGRLLLLLDGLDEVSGDSLRQRVCEYLVRELEGQEPRHIRAVVSCRPTGYGPHRAVLGESFQSLIIRPLDAHHVHLLVRRWFEGARRALPRYSARQLRDTAEDLLSTLDSSNYGSQQLKVLVGSPLLLTLLCVVGLRNGEMPRRRVAFYEQCLRVLLSEWGKIEREREPLLDTDTALAILRPLAYKLHTAKPDSSLPEAEVILHIETRLEELNRAERSFAILDWLHREAGVLTEYAPRRYGFVHSGIKEYLTALHVLDCGEALLEELCERATDGWWEQVVLLLVGVSNRREVAALLERLLRPRVLLEQGDLIRACLREAPEVDLAPFLRFLSGDHASDVHAAVLRLLCGHSDPRFLDKCSVLRLSGSQDVAALAQRCLDDARRQGESPATADADLCFLYHAADGDAARDLAARLDSPKRVWLAGSEAAGPLAKILTARALLILLGPDGELPRRDLDAVLELSARRRQPVVLVRLPGAAAPVPSCLKRFESNSCVDLSAGLRPEALEYLRQLCAGGETSGNPPSYRGHEPVRGQRFIERVTGMQFVWIPGDMFLMGEGPGRSHWVRVSEFWFGEVPVTNRQFAVFLESHERPEPRFWRDPKLAAAEQPVVGTSWQDAVDFCRWLSETATLKASLPSEAQWEYAARGTDGRPYPWGEEPPCPSRACFDLDFHTGRPAPVGRFPAGAGPFGALDQAGNVWQWCRDPWHKDAYRKRGGGAVDPVQTEGNPAIRVARGGGWHSAAEFLQAARRNGFEADRRGEDLGFRVVLMPGGRKVAPEVEP